LKKPEKNLHMTLNLHLKRSAIKHQVIGTFKNHVSSGKAAFFQKYGMDFVMGRREGAFIWDIDGSKRLFNLHCNGGVFNLGHRNIELIELLKAGLDDYDIGNHHLMSKARADLVRLREDKEHYLHDVAADRRVALLQEIDYQTYLRDFADMDEAVLNVMLPAPRSVWAVNSDAFPAYAALNEGYPGFGDLEFAGSDDVEEAEAERDIFHFPDGNASIARLLVRHLIPAVASGDSMEDIVTTRFNYNKLDDSRSPVRLRLNSASPAIPSSQRPAAPGIGIGDGDMG